VAQADRHAGSGGTEFGVRAADGIVDALYSVAAWLREEQHIPANAARPPAQWRKSLKEEWAQRTGKRRARPHRPRHSVDEYRRIFAAIHDPRVDPRIRLAIELAAECRTGQVLRCTRRMLELPEGVPNDYETAPTGSLGQIEIPGAGKKHGEVVVFTPEQRRAVDDALDGYLANYEAALRTGQIDDYYLFPGSKMRMLDKSGRRWTRKVRVGVKPPPGTVRASHSSGSRPSRR
jgi:integrase